jgi:hypothetical protein
VLLLMIALASAFFAVFGANLGSHEIIHSFVHLNNQSFQEWLTIRSREILRLARRRHEFAVMDAQNQPGNCNQFELMVIKDMLAYAKELEHVATVTTQHKWNIVGDRAISEAQAVVHADFIEAIADNVCRTALYFRTTIIDAVSQHLAPLSCVCDLDTDI